MWREWEEDDWGRMKLMGLEVSDGDGDGGGGLHVLKN
jgi:hypothetical protein